MKFSSGTQIPESENFKSKIRLTILRKTPKMTDNPKDVQIMLKTTH